MWGRNQSDTQKSTTSERRSSSIYVNDGYNTIEILPEELEEYEYAGWHRGKIIKARWMHNRTRETMVNESEVEKYLAKGWKLGRLQKKKEKSSTGTQPSKTSSSS